MRLRTALFAFAAACVLGTHVYAGRSLRVHGAARIDGHVGRSHQRLLLEGRVLDDAGSPVPNVAMTVTVSPPGKPPVELAGLVAPCGQDRPIASLRTDESGRYCAWIGVPIGVYTVHLEAGPTPWLTKASVDEAADLAKRSVALRFDPDPRIVTLDAGATTLDVAATFDDDAATAASGLPLTLTTETGAVVASAITGAAGRASFAFDAATLGAPGRGVLRVRFAGDDATMASEHVAPIERDAHVVVVLAQPVAPSAPEDGVVLHVATTLRPVSALVATGAVEARKDGVVVGAAPLDARGRATLRATFAAPRGAKTTELLVRYVPDAPWFQPSGEAPVSVPLRGPRPTPELPFAIGAVALAAWLLVGRGARRGRLDRTLVMQRPPTHEGTAGVSVVHSSRGRFGAYTGRVIDAHDGTPVARARVAVEGPSFPGAGGHAEVLASVFADDHGAFAFELAPSSAGAEIVVEAPLHAELRQRLPGAGVLEIALVSRRRRLLERLVAWARRRGGAFDARPEPTPAQVRRAAENVPAGAPVGAWANAVERAAFDRGDVDARVEAEVMALDPDEARRPPGGDDPAGPRGR